MASMDSGNFVKILNLLDINSHQLVQSLYVSASLVSRWKTGVRELKEDNAYFGQLIDYFLEVNEKDGQQRLEKFLIPEYEGQTNAMKQEALDNLLEHKLRNFLLVDKVSQTTAVTPAGQAGSGFEIVTGLDERIQALCDFFEYALTLNPKPDIYIMEILYASWAPNYVGWIKKSFDYSLKYMDQGGIIYYFSNLHNFERQSFFDSWKFTSHKNLYPGYSINMAEESPGCAYYLITGKRSVTFYAPEDNEKAYVTTVCSNPVMLESQENYLKKRFNQRQQQIFINTFEKRGLVQNYTQLHSIKLTPLLFAGTSPIFLILDENKVKRILKENNVPDKSVRYCLELLDNFRQQIANPALSKTFFYYEEDLLQFAVALEYMDYELSGLASHPVYLSWDDRRDLLLNLRALCADESSSVRIVSKNNAEVYNALGENTTLWVKRNSWYMVFYPEADGETDFRMITDPLACSMRYDLYHSTLLNVQNNNLNAAAFLSRMLDICDNQGK